MIRHRTVDAGGLRVHLAEAGPEDAPPVLLLHGWPQTSHLWRRVGPMLAGEHRVLMPDLRGFGATEAPGHGMDAETFARDQVALLDALGIERALLIGHDWGGYAGFLLAARWPERVGAYLACAAPSPWVTITPPERARASQLLYRSYLRLTVSVARGREAVPPLTVPAHLLLGERDPAIRPVLADGFPSLEIVDAGHFLVDELPELVVARALDVFRRAS